MCYDVKQEEKKIEKQVKIDLAAKKKPYIQQGFDFYHVKGFAHPNLLVITSEEPEYLQRLKWGLIPHTTKDEAEAKILAGMCLNAVSETVFEKKSFTSIKTKRCLLPVNGFFETRWEGKKDNYPYFIYMKDEAPFYLGCVYDIWTNKTTGEVVNTFAILTTEANPLLAKIHNRKNPALREFLFHKSIPSDF